MIAIIDYNAGNLTSVSHALSFIGYPCTVTNDIQTILDAERIIFPGVGAAGSAMKSLKELSLDHTIKKFFSSGKPVLGICLGTQIIMGHSEENDAQCIGIVQGEVKAFPHGLISEDGDKLKIPHMGWNRIKPTRSHPVLAGLHSDDEFYFVHSYYPEPSDKVHTIAHTDYGICFSSIIGFENMIATQFHPEKSGKPGLNFLENFCKWQPC